MALYVSSMVFASLIENSWVRARLPKLYFQCYRDTMFLKQSWTFVYVITQKSILWILYAFTLVGLSQINRIISCSKCWKTHRYIFMYWKINKTSYIFVRIQNRPYILGLIRWRWRDSLDFPLQQKYLLYSKTHLHHKLFHIVLHESRIFDNMSRHDWASWGFPYRSLKLIVVKDFTG